jgi:hypothetical protein
MLKKIGRILLVSVLYYSWHIPFDMTSSFAQNVIAAERVTFEGPGGNVGRMNETAKITRVEVGANGVNVEFTKKDGGDRWPNTCGAPFADPADDCKEDGGRIDMGALQYSLGFVLPVNGTLYGSAPIEYWYGWRDGTGAIQDQSVTCDNGRGQIQCNIYYDGRWPNLRQARPAAGDEIGVFVVAGDARNNFVPLQERSNIVTFRLPAPGATTVVEYGAQSGGESVTDTLKRVRSKYPAQITGKEGAKILNETAWIHRAEGWALLGKAGGNNCPMPTTGARISCDYLIVNRGGVWFGQDVLVSAPGENETSAANPVNDVNPSDNMSEIIASGARSVVLPVDPGGSGPGPVDPPAGDKVTKADLDALKNELNLKIADSNNQTAAVRQSLDALGAALNNTNQNIADQVTAINNALAALAQAGAVPTGCKVTGGVLGIRFSLHCELTK